MRAKLSITAVAVAAAANNSNLPEKVERRREREREKEEELRVKQRKETLSSLRSLSHLQSSLRGCSGPLMEEYRPTVG